MTRTTLVDLNLDEYNRGLRYSPFMVNLHRCNGSFNTLDDPSGRIRVPNKTKEVNLNVFNTITRINDLRTLAKHTSCECKCKFDGRKCNSNQNWNNDKCRCECKNPTKHHVCKRDYIWNPSTCTCQTVNIIGDSVITCDGIIEVTKAVPAKTVPTKTGSTETIPTKTISIKTIPTNFCKS